MNRLLTAGLMSLMFIAPAAADYQSGMAAYTSGDFETARKEFLAGAEAGDAEAQAALGILYARGDGVEKDVAKAAEWFDKASAQGHGRAQHLMGRLHHSGVLGVRDISKAVEYFEKSAATGFVSAFLALASIYYKGDGVEKDLAKAAQNTRIAAEAGIAGAQMHYGFMLLKGEGVQRDPKEAYFWLYRATQEGLREAIPLVVEIPKEEVSIEERMVIERRANEWKPKAPPVK